MSFKIFASFAAFLELLPDPLKRKCKIKKHDYSPIFHPSRITSQSTWSTFSPVLHVLYCVRKRRAERFWEKDGGHSAEDRSAAVDQTRQPGDVVAREKHHGGHHGPYPSHHGHPAHAILPERGSQAIKSAIPACAL